MSKKQDQKYIEACDRMLELVFRDHGGCDQDGCSIHEMLYSDDYRPEEAIHAWACSGAADAEFEKLYDKWGQRLEQELRNGQ